VTPRRPNTATAGVGGRFKVAELPSYGPIARHKMLRRSLILLGEFTRRNFKGRCAGSVMGFLWSFVQPLWSLALFTFLFSTVMKVSPGIGERTASFAVFVFCGLLPWMAVQEGIIRATRARCLGKTPVGAMD